MNLHPFLPPFRRLAAAFLLACACAVSASANDVLPPAINIDFGPAGSPLYSGTAQDPNDSGVVWNRAELAAGSTTLVTTPLVQSNGTQTNSVLTIDNVTAVDNTGGTNPTTNALLEDYLVGGGQPLKFTITSLPPLTRFRLYFYCAGSESGQGSKVQLGSNIASTTATQRTSFVEGVNYIVVTGNSDDRGNFDGLIYSNSTDSTASPVLNGLQIQQDVFKTVTPPTTDDDFDVSQGTVILDGSPTIQGRPLEAAIGGLATNGAPGPGAILFAPGPTGKLDFIEFKMPVVKTIKSISIYTSANLNPIGATRRITLWGFNSVTGLYDIKAFEIFPANPYALTIAPPGAAVENNGQSDLLAVIANIDPVTTDRFKLEYEEAVSNATASGRLIEIDGFQEPNPGLLDQPPIISTVTTTTGQVGTHLSFQLAASNNPTAFDADGLPDGLSLDPETGVISGTPTTEGDFDVAVSAFTNALEGPVATLRITIKPADQAIQQITILSPPSEVAVKAGETLTIYTAVAATTGKLKSVEVLAIDGAGNTTTLQTDTLLARSSFPWQPSVPGDYTLRVVATAINDQASTVEQTIHVKPADGQPAAQISLLSGIENQNFALGSSVKVIAFAADGAGNIPKNVQFYLEGQPLPTKAITGGASNPQVANLLRRPASRFIRDAASTGGGAYYETNVPANALASLLTLLVQDINGISTVGGVTQIVTKPARLASERVSIQTADGSADLVSGDVVPATMKVSVANPSRRIARVSLYANAELLSTADADPYVFNTSTLAGGQTGQTVFTAIATGDDGIGNPSDSVLLDASTEATVTVAANAPRVEAASGEAGEFIVTRTGGDLTKRLVVRYRVTGATAGVYYTPVSGKLKIKPNRTSAKIMIHPLPVEGATGTKKVKIKLLDMDAYTLGTPFTSRLKIAY